MKKNYKNRYNYMLGMHSVKNYNNGCEKCILKPGCKSHKNPTIDSCLVTLSDYMDTKTNLDKGAE